MYYWSDAGETQWELPTTGGASGTTESPAAANWGSLDDDLADIMGNL